MTFLLRADLCPMMLQQALQNGNRLGDFLAHQNIEFLIRYNPWHSTK